MKRAIAMLLFAMSATFAADRERSVLLTEHTDMDGVRYVYELGKDRISTTMPWDGISNEPPLSISNAVAIALDTIKQSDPDYTVLSPYSVAITRIYDHDINDRWYYSVGVNGTTKEGERQFRKSFMIIVLMDKTIVVPKVFRQVSKS